MWDDLAFGWHGMAWHHYNIYHKEKENKQSL